MRLRGDAWLTLHVAAPLSRLRTRTPTRLPILMYHRVAKAAERRVHPYFWTNTTPARFAEHMQGLRALGVKSLTLREAAAALREGETRDRVCITFDDGYQDLADTVMPILGAHGFTATVFLPTASIAEPRQRFRDVPCLTWREVRALHAAGIEFGSHTVSHPELRDLPDEAVARELRDSKDAIEQQIGAPVTSFAYPYAFPEERVDFVRRLRGHLTAFGYTAGVTTILGTATPAHDALLLPRLPVNSEDDHALLVAKLRGHYDWVHGLQCAYKHIARRRPRRERTET